MYIRKNTRKYKNKTYQNYLLVESVSTPKGPRQRTICSLGDCSVEISQLDWLKREPNEPFDSYKLQYYVSKS